MKCDQCKALMINGVFCHESGCPNRNSVWNEERGRWIKQRECRECGCTIELGEVCDCQEPIEDDSLEEEPERLCIVDGCFGIYVPTRFATKFRDNSAYCVLHVTPADWDELEKGPDEEGYWDLWQDICDAAEIIDNETGEHFRLEQDGDLFLVAMS